MKTISFKQNKLQGYKILELEPCRRTIFLNSSIINLPLPYIYFLINYSIDKSNFVYHGVLGSGLQIYCSKTPIISMKSTVGLLPFESSRHGLVCTDHDYDYKSFSSLEQLEKTILSSWWQSKHYLEYNPFPSLCSYDNLLRYWSKCSYKDMEFNRTDSLKTFASNIFRRKDDINLFETAKIKR